MKNLYEVVLVLGSDNGGRVPYDILAESAAEAIGRATEYHANQPGMIEADGFHWRVVKVHEKVWRVIV